MKINEESKVKDEDKHIKCARALPIKIHPEFRIDVHYIFDDNQQKYRMYIDDLKYKRRMEIIYSNDKKCFVIKSIEYYRNEWNTTHKDKVELEKQREEVIDVDNLLNEDF